MKTINPNYWMLLARIAILPVLAFIYQFPLEKVQTGEYMNDPILFFSAVATFSLLPIYFIWTLFAVYYVSFSDDNTTLYYYRFYKKGVVTKVDIECYSKRTHYTKIKRFHSIVIKLQNGKKVEFSEDNLKSLTNVQEFLRINGIRCSIHQRFPITNKSTLHPPLAQVCRQTLK